MTRWFLIALALAACSKGKESAPAATTATATDDKPATPPVATTPSPTQGNRAEVVETARNQGGLGVSTHTSSFDPLPGEGGDKGTAKPKADPSRHRDDAPKTGGGGDGVKVGSSGPTRGDAAKLSYRAQIVDVKLDGRPAPVALVKAIKANLLKVQACYDKTLASWPALVGELAVTFTVLPTGTLTAGAVGTSTVKQDVLETCVIGALQATKLASPLGKTEAKAEVTITFKAK